MKKPLKKLAFGAAVAAAAFHFSACRNRPEAVYGPPEYFNKETAGKNTEAGTTTAAEAETTTAAETETPAAAETETPAAADFTPETNVPVCVYGPPEWFEGDGSGPGPKPVTPADDPDPEFDPDANMNMDVYGPPEMFGIDEGDAEAADDAAPAEEKK